uniref:ribonuclease H n=1 Tax=Hucho hucho TaxID=62062 RepID=A0A4W5QRZ7_9TELE
MERKFDFTCTSRDSTSPPSHPGSPQWSRGREHPRFPDLPRESPRRALGTVSRAHATRQGWAVASRTATPDQFLLRESQRDHSVPAHPVPPDPRGFGILLAPATQQLINWSTGAIMGWSPFCHAHCLKSAQPAPGRLGPRRWVRISPPWLKTTHFLGLRATLRGPVCSPSCIYETPTTCADTRWGRVEDRLQHCQRPLRIYLVMPFGLNNAPAVFKALVNDVLHDMLNQFVFVYIDDILVFFRSSQEHVLHVWQVLQRLLENQLFVKAEKCEFHRSTIPFLGYIISAGSVTMDTEKVKAVVDWPQPTSRVQLQCILGFVNFYHSFIRGYSTLASSLSALTSTKVPFTWSTAVDRVFQDLKHRVTTAPILVHPDPDDGSNP